MDLHKCKHDQIAGCCEDDLDCDDGNGCTLDVCKPEGCVYSWLVDGTVCEDGSACTEGDFCKAGECIPGKSVVCPKPKVCWISGCDPLFGCWTEPLPDGTKCGEEGVCVGGSCCMPPCLPF